MRFIQVNNEQGTSIRRACVCDLKIFFTKQFSDILQAFYYTINNISCILYGALIDTNTLSVLSYKSDTTIEKNTFYYVYQEFTRAGFNFRVF